MITKLIAYLIGMYLTFLPLTSSAESINEFLRRSLTSDLGSNHFHSEAKYLFRIGDLEQPLTRPQLISYFATTKTLITKSEIIDFSILSEYEAEGIISVVSKSRVRLTMGAGIMTGESISHDILKRQNDSFVSIFNYTKQ